MEDHLRGVVKDLLRSTGRVTKQGGLVKDINGTSRIPYKGMLNKLSLQASAPYDAVKQEEKRLKTLHQILRTDKEKDFITTAKVKYPTIVRTDDERDPYLDKWANPMLTRGVPANQAQLKESIKAKKPLFAMPTDPKHPWYYASSGNKSAVHPNNVFDIIADAELTGGVTKRHLGSTERFGLAPSSDNRGLSGSTLPPPPIKDTTLLYGDSTKLESTRYMYT